MTRINREIKYLKRIEENELDAQFKLGFNLPNLEAENQYNPLKNGSKYVEAFYCKSYFGSDNQYAAYTILIIDSEGKYYSSCMMSGIRKRKEIVILLDEEPESYLKMQSQIKSRIQTT